MSQPAAGRADFQQYASWLGTPSAANLVTFNPGTTVIADLNLSNFLSLFAISADISGNGVLQFQFFTDQTKSQSVDVYQYILATGNALSVNIPMIAPFVEISAIVQVGHTLELDYVLIPNNMPTIRPVYPGQVRNVSANGLSIAAGGNNMVTPQYIIPGSTYVYFQPSDATGKLDLNIWALDSTGAKAYKILKFQAPTAPTWATILLPASAVEVEVDNTDGAAAHVCGYTIQQIGN